jgi:hypothetical protein
VADKKFSELPAATTPAGTEVVPIVQGGATKRTTAQAIADLASRAWSTITGKPTTLAGYGITDAATAAQGALAATAVQPDDLADVATSGAYTDLSGRPTLGTAAASAATDFATASQGALADTATQPGDLATVATTGAYSDLTGKPTLGSAAAQDVAAFAAAIHTHAAGDMVSGTFDNARVAQSNVTQHQAALSIAWSQLTSLPSFFSGDVGDLTGFPGGTTNFLRADGTFAAPPGAGSVSWGGITGTLSDQEDLQDALDAKADSATTLAGYGITDAATSAQGTLADTALQADDVAGFSIAWSQITGEPTTLSGYGITDAAPAARSISTTAPLTGGGDLSANRTFAIPAATASVDGYATSAQITKLNGIATGATANSSDATLLARANHTGTQAWSTIVSTPTTLAGYGIADSLTAAVAAATYETITNVALKANIASPTFTGTPAAPTASAATNTTQLATTAFVQGEIAAKAPLASPTFTGTPAAPSAAFATSTTQLATTAFVQAAVSRVVVNSQSGAYTAVLGDAGAALFHPAADTTARIFTIPANSSVAYAVGTVLTFINQNGAGVITIAITTDTMRLAGAGTTGSRTLAANGIATATKIATTEWLIAGTGLS